MTFGLGPLTTTFVFFFFAFTSTQYSAESTGTPAASVDIVIDAALSNVASTAPPAIFAFSNASSAVRSPIVASRAARCAASSSAPAPAGAGAGGDGGFDDASSATPRLPVLAVRAGVSRERDASAGALPVAGAAGDCGCARFLARVALAAGALAATLVLPPWIRVSSARLARVIGGMDARTAA